MPICVTVSICMTMVNIENMSDFIHKDTLYITLMDELWDVYWGYIVGNLPWHNDTIKWKHFLRYWPFVSPENSPHKGQWRGALMFSLICTWTNSWLNNWDAADLRCHRAHYDITVMILLDSAVSGKCTGHCFSRKTIFSGLWISVIKIWQFWDHFILTMGIGILARQHFILRQPSGSRFFSLQWVYLHLKRLSLYWNRPLYGNSCYLMTNSNATAFMMVYDRACWASELPVWHYVTGSIFHEFLLNYSLISLKRLTHCGLVTPYGHITWSTLVQVMHYQGSPLRPWPQKIAVFRG